MRKITLVIPVALLSLVTACGSSSTPAADTTAAPTTAAATETGASAGAAGVLTGEVGKDDAFTITLMDDKGAPVTTLKAGTYEIKIKDESAKHNFHLTGDGVEETTTVPEIKEVTWSVTFKPGTYNYKCDPHANMKGSITVT